MQSGVSNSAQAPATPVENPNLALLLLQLRKITNDIAVENSHKIVRPNINEETKPPGPTAKDNKRKRPEAIPALPSAKRTRNLASSTLSPQSRRVVLENLIGYIAKRTLTEEMDLEGKSFRMSWNVSITVTNSAIGKPGEGQTTVFARESCPPHHFKAIIHWIEQFLNEPEEAKKSMPPKIVDAFRENVISGKTTYPFSYTFTINLVKSAVFKQTSLVLVSAQFGSLLSSCCNLQIVIKELDELRSLGTLCVDSVTVGVNNNKKPKNKKLLEKFLKLQRPRRLAIVVDNKVCPTRIIPYIIEPLRDPENEWVQHYSYISLDMGPVVVSNYENRIRAYCEFLTIFSSVLFKFDKIEVIDYCLESHLATVPSNPPPPNALKELSNLEVSNGTILAIRDLFLHLQLSFDHLGLVTLPDSFALLSVMQHWFDATFQKNAQSWADHIAFRKPDPNAYTREAPLVGLYVWYIFTSILNQVWNKRHDDATIEFITTKLNMNFDEVVLPVTVLQKGTHSLRSIIQIFTRYKQNIFVRLLNGYRMNRKSFFHQE